MPTAWLADGIQVKNSITTLKQLLCPGPRLSHTIECRPPALNFDRAVANGSPDPRLDNWKQTPCLSLRGSCRTQSQPVWPIENRHTHKSGRAAVPSPDQSQQTENRQSSPHDNSEEGRDTLLSSLKGEYEPWAGKGGPTDGPETGQQAVSYKKQTMNEIFHPSRPHIPGTNYLLLPLIPVILYAHICLGGELLTSSSAGDLRACGHRASTCSITCPTYGRT